MRCGNVVGYQNIESADGSFSGGLTFLTIGGTDGQFTLADFKAIGMDPYNDFVQFLSTDNAAPYVYAVYLDKDTYGEDLEGWWDYFDVGGTPLNEQSFANGTAFLVANGSGNQISFQYAGQVATGTDCSIVIPEGTGSPFICNPTPVALTLGQVTAVGMDPYNDFFQYLSPSDASPITYAVYLDKDTYGEDLEGWWDYFDVGGTPLNEEPLAAGGALLGAVGSGNEIVVTFPDPLAKKAE